MKESFATAYTTACAVQCPFLNNPATLLRLVVAVCPLFMQSKQVNAGQCDQGVCRTMHMHQYTYLSAQHAAIELTSFVNNCALGTVHEET